MELRELDIVRIRTLHDHGRDISGTTDVQRDPIVGDPGTVVHVLKAGRAYAVESVTADGLTRWLGDFDAAELDALPAEEVDAALRTASLWDALRSNSPLERLVEVATKWKDAGATQDEATAWLNAFLETVCTLGKPDEDDAVGDVLDLVTGFCSPHARLFPD